MQNPLVLYTIGHSNLSADEFLALLRQHHIRVLVDVRSAPYSRYVPHFNKAALQPFLTSNGVDYRFAGDYLGGRPKQAEVYKDNQLPDEDTERADFLEMVRYEEVSKQDWFRKGINRLLTLVEEAGETGGHVAGVAIMCSEADPLECHRHHLITRSLVDPAWRWIETPVQVQHIVKGGALRPADASMFFDIPEQPSLF